MLARGLHPTGEMAMNRIFQSTDYVAVHENPIWRDRSNFLIRVYLQENEGRGEWEQLWANQVDDKKFVLCCIPFFAYNLALGDEVETDKNYIVQSVVRASGQYTLRIWFGNSIGNEVKDEVLSYLEAMDVLCEWSSANLLAVSAKNSDHAQQIANYLCTRQSENDLMYETGWGNSHV